MTFCRGSEEPPKITSRTSSPCVNHAEDPVKMEDLLYNTPESATLNACTSVTPRPSTQGRSWNKRKVDGQVQVLLTCVTCSGLLSRPVCEQMKSAPLSEISHLNRVSLGRSYDRVHVSDPT